MRKRNNPTKVMIDKLSGATYSIHRRVGKNDKSN
jgi:hypothetical protein